MRQLRTGKKRFLLKLYTAIAVVGAVLFCSFGSGQWLSTAPVPEAGTLADSTDRLQTFLNEQFRILADYNRLQFNKQDGLEQIAKQAKRGKEAKDSLQKLKPAIIAWLHGKAGKETEDQSWQTFQNYKFLVGQMESQEKEAKNQADSLAIQSKALEAQLAAAKEKYTETAKRLADLSRTLSGYGEISIDRATYRYFVVNSEQQNIRVHNPKGGASSFQAVQQQLAKAKTDALMITNGGMFAPGFKPVGLLIEDAKALSALDTLKPEGPNPQNFYLLPNGVFYIDSTGGHVLRTDSFKRIYPGKVKPTYATQSGPMLVADNQINSHFKAGSVNVNIRNGVGITGHGRSVFVISDTPVNFFDFTLVFKEVFNCRDALYLDGAISQMYIPEKVTKKQRPTNGDFGPIISVTTRKK